MGQKCHFLLEKPYLGRKWLRTFSKKGYKWYGLGRKCWLPCRRTEKDPTNSPTLSSKTPEKQSTRAHPPTSMLRQLKTIRSITHHGADAVNALYGATQQTELDSLQRPPCAKTDRKKRDNRDTERGQPTAGPEKQHTPPETPSNTSPLKRPQGTQTGKNHGTA